MLFAFTSVMEKMLLLHLDKSPTREHYLSTTFLAVCLFMLILKFNRTRPSVISGLGNRDSLYIYIFHPLFLMVLPSIIKRTPTIVRQCYSWTAPLTVLLLTMVLIFVARKTKLIK